MDEIEVKIETVGENPNKISPLLSYFPSGFDPSVTEGHEPDSSPLQPTVGVFRNMKRSNRLQVVVSPNNSKVDFVGTNYTGEAVCTYALGVLDKSTKRLQIVPIAANKAKKCAALHQKLEAESQKYLEKKLERERINKEAFEVDATTSYARNIPAL
ncbi:hypothetical protein LguiA_028799 [Lonicera macranthoides]